jgi:hypothetical protein
MGFLLTAVEPSPAATTHTSDEVVLVEPNGRWHIRQPGRADYTFWYGTTGDTPLLGDWDGDGWDTPGMYRSSTGLAYLTNELPPDAGVGLADPLFTFYFGAPGDQILVGDWNSDGTDTLGIRRDTRVYLTNVNATSRSEWDFWFGIHADVAVAGDPDGNGFDNVFLFRPASGFVHYTTATPGGSGLMARTMGEFYFGVAGDRLVVGDWDGDGVDAAGIFRPSRQTIYLRNSLDTGPADIAFEWGETDWTPVAGRLRAAD